MKKVFSFVLILLNFLFLTPAISGQVFAIANCDMEVRDSNYNIVIPVGSRRNFNFSAADMAKTYKFSYYIDKDHLMEDYQASFENPGTIAYGNFYGEKHNVDGNFIRYESDVDLTIFKNLPGALLHLDGKLHGEWVEDICPTVNILVGETSCKFEGTISATNTNIAFTLNHANLPKGESYNVLLKDSDNKYLDERISFIAGENGGKSSMNFPHSAPPTTKDYILEVYSAGINVNGAICASRPFKISASTEPVDTENAGNSSETLPFQLCSQAGKLNSVEFESCETCFETEGVWTALGCIPYGNTTSMVNVFMTIGLGLAGMVIVLMVLGGSFLLSTSQGDPKRVEEARGMISSAVMGLLFVIFSITILRFIGVRILQIPGFGT